MFLINKESVRSICKRGFAINFFLYLLWILTRSICFKPFYRGSTALMINALYNAVHPRFLLLIYNKITWKKFLIVQMMNWI